MKPAQRPKPKGQSKVNKRGPFGKPHLCGSRLVVLAVLATVIMAGTTAYAAHFGYRVIAPEMVGEDVYYLQDCLNRLGLYQGEMTEHYDYDTQQSVRRFQQMYRLPNTGWVDGNTTCAVLSAITQGTNLVIDGQYQLFTPAPVLADGLLYIPIEALEALGISHEIKNDQVTLRSGSELWPVTVADQNGMPTLDATGRATAREWQDTLYLPLRSLATWIGAAVNWDADTRTAHVELPVGYRPYQASGPRFLRRVASVSYPDRVRLVFYLASTTKETYNPRGLSRDPSSGDWLGQLEEITIGAESRQLALNDPTIRTVRLTALKGTLHLVVTPSDGQKIASCEWLLDPEYDRLILDLYRAQR